MGSIPAFFTLLLSQIFPTFGVILGSAGNGLSYAISIVGFGFSLILFLLQGVPRNIFLFLTLFYFLAITYVLVLTLTSPLPFALRDLSSVAKFLTIYLALMCGYCSYKGPNSFKTFFIIAGIACGLNIILLIAHWFQPFNPLQMLYFYRDVGFRRFPGTWNHPYNLSVFFYLVTLFAFYKILKSKTGLNKIGYFILLGLAIYVCLFATQARSGFAAFWLTNVYGAFIFILYAISRNRAREMVGGVLSIATIVCTAIVTYIYLQYALSMGQLKHLTKLVDPQEGLPQHRLSQVHTLIEQYWSEYPYRAIIGFGTGRGDEFNLESAMNYVFQYGIIGALLFVMGIWFILFFKTLKTALNTRDTDISYALLLANMGIMYIFLMGVSTDVMMHYRFVPLAYFLAGMAFAWWHKQKNFQK